jgi:hypothetical protein
MGHGHGHGDPTGYINVYSNGKAFFACAACATPMTLWQTLSKMHTLLATFQGSTFTLTDGDLAGK